MARIWKYFVDIVSVSTVSIVGTFLLSAVALFVWYAIGELVILIINNLYLLLILPVFFFILYRISTFIIKKIKERDFIARALQLIAYVMSRHDQWNPHKITSVRFFIQKNSDYDTFDKRLNELVGYLRDLYHDLEELIKNVNTSRNVSYEKKLDLLRCVSLIKKHNGVTDYSIISKIASGLKIKEHDAECFLGQSKSKKVGSSDFITLSLVMMVKVMHIDWSNKVVEMDVIKSFIWTYDREYYAEWLSRVNSLIKNRKSEIDVEAAIASIKKKFNDSEVDELIYYMFDVAYVDGKCTDEEAKFIEQVVSALYHNDSSAYKSRFDIFNILKNDRTKYREKFRSDWRKKSDENNDNSKNTKSTRGERAKSSNTSSSKHNISPELQKAYAVLNIPVDASNTEISACRRNFMRINHPDLFATRGAQAVEKATLKCQEFNKAFDIVKKSRGM